MKLGVEVFLSSYVSKFKGKRIGLLTNLTGVNHKLESTIDLFYEHPDLELTALFGPEHGLRGEVQEGILIDSAVDSHTNLPIYSLYNKEKSPDPNMLQEVDVVICDLQDIGTRYYTFIYTMANMMKLCAEVDKHFVVLDRPNPINGIDVEGNIVAPNFQSFVGQYPIAVRHGLTIGEMATLINQEYGINGELEVIRLEGWSRDMFFDETDLSWVSPTPNTTSIDMCVLYPGTCLIEGTNVSEGRGTTKPFEVIGAPFIRGRELSNELTSYQLHGVLFRPTVFKPQFQKHAGEICEGIQIHIVERSKINSFELGVHLLQAIKKLYPNDISFIKSPDFNNRHFIDLLAGTDQLRVQLEQGNTTEFMNTAQLEQMKFKQTRKNYLLY